LLCVFVAVAVTLLAGRVCAQDDPATAAVELFNAGQDAHERGDLKKAVELYQRALKELPEFPEAEYQLGIAHLALERRNEAEAAFRRAMALREDWTLPQTALASVLVQRGAFSEALPLLEKIIADDAQNAGAVAALADLRLRTGASREILAEALAAVRSLTEKAKPAASLWIARAALERALGDIPGARSSIGRALDAEPSNRGAIAERAEIALAANDARAALADAESLLRNAPDSAPLRFLYARALAADGDTARALQTVERIVPRTAEMEDLRTRLNALATTDTAALEKRLEADPNDISALGRLCSLLRVPEPVRAFDFCVRAYGADQSNVVYAIGAGAALVQAKNYPKAAQLLSEIVARNPDNYTARANYAVALFQLKRWAEAKTQYRWLTERQPELAAAYYFLGIIHDQLKEYMDAMANYQRFLKLADTEGQKLEIEKVNLRLPSLQKQLRSKN
jgi:tetratricopeptide (TPR) repeat protein